MIVQEHETLQRYDDKTSSMLSWPMWERTRRNHKEQTSGYKLFQNKLVQLYPPAYRESSMLLPSGARRALNDGR
eukprot:616198-Amphidinium_carterae.1